MRRLPLHPSFRYRTGPHAVINYAQKAGTVVLSPEYPVTGVPEPGEDVAVVVQLPVEGGGVDRDIGMGGGQGGYPFRGGDQTEELDALRSVPLDDVEGGDGASPVASIGSTRITCASGSSGSLT